MICSTPLPPQFRNDFNNNYGYNYNSQQQQQQMVQMKLQELNQQMSNMFNSVIQNRQMPTEQINILRQRWNDFINAAMNDYMANGYNPASIPGIFQMRAPQFAVPSTMYNPTVSMLPTINQMNSYNQMGGFNNYGMQRPTIGLGNNGGHVSSVAAMYENNYPSPSSGGFSYPSSNSDTTPRTIPQEPSFQCQAPQQQQTPQYQTPEKYNPQDLDSVGKSMQSEWIINGKLPPCDSVSIPVHTKKISIKGPGGRKSKIYARYVKAREMRYQQLMIKENELVIDNPVSSEEAAIHRVIDSNPEAASDNSINVVSYDEVKLIRVPYEEGKKFMEKAIEAFDNVKENLNRISEFIKTLNGFGSFGIDLKNHAYSLFNKYVNVVAVTTKDKSVLSLKQIKPNDDLAFVDIFSKKSNEDLDIKNMEGFEDRIKFCLSKSFGAIFDKGETNNPHHLILDNDPLNQQLILSMDTFGYATEKMKDSRFLLAFSENNSNDEAAIEQLTKRVFPLLISKTIMFHNLSGIEAPEWNDVGLHFLNTSNIQAFIKEHLTNRSVDDGEVLDGFHACMEVIDINDPTQLKHPLVMSLMNEGMVAVRRTY